MFELFTERATDVITFAQEEAIEISYRSIGSEDVLLGLLRQGSGVFAFRKPGHAAKALEAEGLSLRKIRTVAKKFRRRDQNLGSVEFHLAGDTYSKVIHLEFTEHAKLLQLAAKTCATASGDKQIGTAHLLIGLLSLDDCNGAKVLQDLQVDCDRLRKRVVKLMQTSKHSD